MVMNGVKGMKEGHAWVSAMWQMVKLVYIDHTSYVLYSEIILMLHVIIFVVEVIICHSLWMESKWLMKERYGNQKYVKWYSWSILIILHALNSENRLLIPSPQLFCCCILTFDTQAVICHFWWMESKCNPMMAWLPPICNCTIQQDYSDQAFMFQSWIHVCFGCSTRLVWRRPWYQRTCCFGPWYLISCISSKMACLPPYRWLYCPIGIERLYHYVPKQATCVDLYMCFFGHFDAINHQWQMMASGSNWNKQQQNSGGHCSNHIFVNSEHGIWSI
jgi:hypothetical protein